MTFAAPSILSQSDPLFEQVVSELGSSPKEIHLKSKQLLSKILHNYAAFDISTIDKFTQKLIRTFAFDLKLPMNFEVELDTDLLLTESGQSFVVQSREKQGTHKSIG